MNDKNLTAEKISVVSAYLTPLALIVLFQALLYTGAEAPMKYIAPLVGLAVLNNLMFTYLLKKTHVLLITRMTVNVIINVFLVYFLIGNYTPIWFLFLLTPIATAVYSTRLKTFFCALGVSALLLSISIMRIPEFTDDIVNWGETFSRIILIVLLSLFINAISPHSKKTKKEIETAPSEEF